MSKKIILFFVAVIFFSGFNLARADVVINEIFYSTISKQWVEIYNNTDSDIDITQYKIKDAGVVNGHNIVPAVSGGSNIIPAHAYGVIAKDITSISATYLFHAALGIAPAGDTVILKNSDNPAVDTVLVSLNSAADGNSLQLIDSVWKAALPTPGAQNEDSPPPVIDSNSGNDSVVTNTSSSSSKNSPKNEPKILIITTKIISPKIVVAGIPFSFGSLTTSNGGETYAIGKFVWNFGDGDTKEIINNTNFSHTYFYPGDYVVTLGYYSNSFSKVPDALNKTTIKVIPTALSIGRVGDDKDFFIELYNDSIYEVDISNYLISSLYKTFVLPSNSNVLAKSKIILSPKITSFSISDKNSLKLLNPQGELIFDYNSPIVQAVPFGKIIEENVVPVQVSKSNENTTNKAIAENITQNLTASAIESDAIKDNNPYFFPIILFLLLGAGGGAVYFIRRKKAVSNAPAGDDFDIMS